MTSSFDPASEKDKSDKAGPTSLHDANKPVPPLKAQSGPPHNAMEGMIAARAKRVADAGGDTNKAVSDNSYAWNATFLGIADEIMALDAQFAQAKTATAADKPKVYALVTLIIQTKQNLLAMPRMHNGHALEYATVQDGAERLGAASKQLAKTLATTANLGSAGITEDSIHGQLVMLFSANQLKLPEGDLPPAKPPSADHHVLDAAITNMFDAAEQHAAKTSTPGADVAGEKTMFVTNVAQIVASLTALDDHGRAGFYKSATKLKTAVSTAEMKLKAADHDLTMSSAVESIQSLIPKPTK